jgi:4-amino-4-deoxy-L-arabinose transferase-like glycosyltransferase
MSFIKHIKLLFTKFRYLFLYFIFLFLNVLIKSWNIFKNPVYTEDEGTYVSQATAIITHGKLSYYTYWYDHAPIGWFVIAIWQKLIRSLPFIFQNYIDETRVFMVLCSSISLILIIKICKQIEIRNWIICFISTIYIFSPLAITYQRAIFLDNIMIMFVLASVYIILIANNYFYWVSSSILFAFAILTKETAIFFIPFIIFILFSKAYSENKVWIITLWITILIIVLSQYFTFALLKGEFFPSNSIFGSQDKVSLIDTLLFQNNRSEQFWIEGSSLRRSLSNSWLKYDPILVLMGTFSILGNIFLIKNRNIMYYGLVFSVGYIFYLLKWRALDFYIIPLIPPFILSIALFLNYMFDIKKFKYFAYIFSIVVLIFYTFQFQSNKDLLVRDLTDTQNEAIIWINENTTGDDFIVIDNFMFLDVNNFNNEISDMNAHYFWKVEKDPDIRNNLLHDSFDEIDYVVLTFAMSEAIESYDFPFLKKYLSEADVVKEFSGEYPIKIYSINKDKNSPS